MRTLPNGVVKLTDANAKVNLPASVPPGSFCNKQLDVLVNEIGRNKKTWRRSLVLLDWLLQMNHKPDSRFCTTIIRICAQNGQHRQALDVYDWMVRSSADGGAGITATQYTYTVAMRAALDGNLARTAVVIWKCVHQQGLVPDSYLCCAYMETCMKLGRMEDVLNVFNDMKTMSKAPPPVHAYTIAMRASTASGNCRGALELWDELESRVDVTPSGVNNSHYVHLNLSIMCAWGMWW